MRILLLCSAFNGLTQRTWIELCAAGHDVTVELALDSETIVSAVAHTDPDVIICPFLKHRVPAEVWSRHRTIIIHPGPMGDRGPSSLDWAISGAESTWGVTALQAVEEMDAGPIWATRVFELGAEPWRKSALYNGPVADAAVALVHEVVRKAADPAFTPEPLVEHRPGVIGRLRPAMRAADREFDWSDPTDDIVRRIRAADGSPGAPTVLAGRPVRVYDADPGPLTSGRPGSIARRRDDALLVRTGDGSVWIGQLRVEGSAVKLPAGLALARELASVPVELHRVDEPDDGTRRREISYQRRGAIGVLTFDFYNGAMSTGQCRRLLAALQHAISQPTKVLILRGGDSFSNGIHLGVIEAAPSPATEAWRNINAIDDVCRAIIDCTTQLVVASLSGNAGAGGVMLALGADRVVLREDAVLNPHYATMGLFGSEYWTYVLPRRVGPTEAATLTTRCLPIGAAEAARNGLVDNVLPGLPAEFETHVLAAAQRLADCADHRRSLDAKQAARRADEQRKPLEAYRIEELAEMSRDIFDDRRGFSAARHAFLTKQRPDATQVGVARAG